jgi:hypothetical protein
MVCDGIQKISALYGPQLAHIKTQSQTIVSREKLRGFIMALTYDFDMFSIIPTDVQARYGDLIAELGVPETLGTQRALFRDASAVEILKGASEAVKTCLMDSGFGLSVYDSGAGCGRYPASDAPARAQVIERLMENLEKLPSDADWNGFDIEAFAMDALTAKPREMAANPAPLLYPAQVDQQRETSHPQSKGNGGEMDVFFSAPASTQAKTTEGAPADIDSFFSKPATAAATQPLPSGPDMDAFFSAPPKLGKAAQTPRAMTAEDIRMTIDSAPPRKVGIGAAKMGMMALGLFVVVTLLGNGNGAAKLVEVATGGKMVTVQR